MLPQEYYLFHKYVSNTKPLKNINKQFIPIFLTTHINNKIMNAPKASGLH